RAVRRHTPYRQLRQRLIAHIDRVPTLPRLLAARGYQSHQSGKWWEGNYRRGGFTAGMTHGEVCGCLRQELGFGEPLVVA
ncbi:MAG: hypothetical protein ACE5EG_04805, partial [Thermoanaerobaculia bacterium]